MKKLVFFLFVIIILSYTFFSQQASYQAEVEQTYQVIPDEAIRLRILAHSDEDEDQVLKHEIRDAINNQITEWVEDLININDARQLIEENISELQSIAEQVVLEQSSDRSIKVEYKEDVTFPVKLYDNLIYPAGEYEAILITIGAGKGSNWWCVLFPPLCFLDFGSTSHVAEAASDEEEEVKEEEPVKVKFFLFEWLGWT